MIKVQSKGVIEIVLTRRTIASIRVTVQNCRDHDIVLLRACVEQSAIQTLSLGSKEVKHTGIHSLAGGVGALKKDTTSIDVSFASYPSVLRKLFE